MIDNLKRKIIKILKKIKKTFNISDYILLIIMLLIIILGITKLGIIKGLLAAIGIIIAMGIYYGGMYMTNKKGTNKSSKTKNSTKSKVTNKKEDKPSKTKVVKKNKNKKILKRVLSICLMFAIFIILGGIAFISYVVISAPKFDPDNLVLTSSSLVYANQGEEIATLAINKREVITYDQLSQVVIDALVATEDSRFFQHNGFDLPRFLKASINQLLGKSDAGGASTLSMQVVKNNFTDPKKDSGFEGIKRKFTDIYLAIFQLERKYTKEEIIEFYLNDSFLGSNSYGIEQASQTYFGKSAGELTLTEAALLVGLYQSPTTNNPYVNPEKASERRATVLYLMKRHGYITEEEEEIANSISVESLLVGKSNNTKYQSFLDTVIAEVTEITGKSPFKVSMKIYTTLDKGVQDGVDKIYSGETYTWENEAVQAGLAIVDVETGAIVALGSGRSEGEGLLNFNTSIKRQPGSSAKPLFDYGPGFEYNNFSTYTLFMDEPYQYTTGTSIRNYDGGYKGLITLRYALMDSRNIPALKAFQQVKNSNINKFVTSLGIEPDYEGSYPYINEAHAIGAFTGVSPLQQAAAYAAFANGGYYTEPYTITKIVYRDTNEEEVFTHKKERVMSDSTAFMMSSVLKSAVEGGLHGGAKVSGVDVAAKTGTTNYTDDTKKYYGLPDGAVRDVWTIAYTKEYSVGLWYGYKEESRENTAKGYYLTNNVQKEKIMSMILNNVIPKTTKKFTAPSSVVEVVVEKETWPAMLASPYTPDDMKLTEYFKKGTEPTEVSQRYNKLNDVTNLNMNVSGNTINLTWNYNTPNYLTNDYLQTYFKQSVFGNSSTSSYNNRLSYNTNVLGNLGFGIYVGTSTGLERVGFTTNNNYNFTLSSTYLGSNVNIIVKAEYEKFKSNSSEGVSKQINSGAITTNLSMELIGNSSITINSGSTYNDSGIKVLYDGTEISSGTSGYSLSIRIQQGANIETVNTISELTSKIITTTPGTTYTIRYTVTYHGETTYKTRTIEVS